MAKASDKVKAPLFLSDGRAVVIKKAKGRDLEKGAAAAANAANPMSLMMGVIAQVVTLDGKPIVYEGVLELDMVDVFLLLGEVSGNVPGLSPLSGISS